MKPPPITESPADFARPRWPERRFEFGKPLWMLADFLERLRGVTPRVSALLADVDEDLLHRQHEGAWSIVQNVGHLADVEDLWQERLEDLRHAREIYTPADPRRFQEAAERHRSRALPEIVAELAERRRALVEALASAPHTLQRASAYHERLLCRMRLIDCAQFYAEHDDHHLVRVRALLDLFQTR
jgi:uncharacterized damage-inducible protein DinB